MIVDDVAGKGLKVAIGFGVVNTHKMLGG